MRTQRISIFAFTPSHASISIYISTL